MCQDSPVKMPSRSPRCVCRYVFSLKASDPARMQSKTHRHKRNSTRTGHHNYVVETACCFAFNKPADYRANVRRNNDASYLLGCSALPNPHSTAKKLLESYDGSHLLVQQRRQVVEICSDLRVIRTVNFLVDSQRALVKRLGLIIFPLECKSTAWQSLILVQGESRTAEGTRLF